VGPALEGTIFGSAATVVVDDGVAQDAVEPGHSGLFAAEAGGLLNGADVGALDDVLGGIGGVDAPAHEVKELFALEDQVGDCLCLHRCGGSVRGGGEGCFHTARHRLFRCGTGTDGATGAGLRAGALRAARAYAACGHLILLWSGSHVRTLLLTEEGREYYSLADKTKREVVKVISRRKSP
jgi:hypothetical protein